VKAIKLWLLWWLGAASVADLDAFYVELNALRSGDKQTMRDEYRAVISELKADHEAAITELIQELNDVRNSIPAALTQSARRPVRVFRNFREFRTIVEGSKKIPIERNS
jgi:hypothetical protein